MREIPEPLRTKLEGAVNRLSDPYHRDEVTGRTPFEDIFAIHGELEAAGTPDPFVTELLATLTRNPSEAIKLFEASISQCNLVLGEPRHTKRLDLAMRYAESGDSPSARRHLEIAHAEALAAGDSDNAEIILTYLGEVGV